MAEPESDPALLFTPTKATTSDFPPQTSDAPSPASDLPKTPSPPQKPTRPSTSRTFFVAPPILASAEKSQYTDRLPDGLMTDVEFDTEELRDVMGEYRENGVTYYFARLKDGIAHKFNAKLFRAKYPEFVEEYKRKKRLGTLDPFDPSAHYVHYKSRLRNVVNINMNHAKKPAKKIARRHSDSDEVPDSTIEDVEGDDEDDYEDDGTPQGPRRTRATAHKKASRTLPFSPKKTRSNKAPIVPDSEDDELAGPVDDSDIEIIPARRSTRARKSAKTNLAEADDYIDVDAEESEPSSDDDAPRRSKKPKTQTKLKIVRGKASRPAYGHFRVVADLELDGNSDEETAPLRAHRDVCEKCRRGPTHALLEALRTRPKGKGKKKKKGSDDDLESSGDEQEKTTALGGWVRCLKCPVSAHWKCLAMTQQDEILKAARDLDRAALEAQRKSEDEIIEPKKRPGLGAYQTTEFICGSCMKGGICLGCKEVALQADPGPQPKVQPNVSSPEKDVGSAAQAVEAQSKDEDVDMADGTKTNTAPPADSPRHAPEDNSPRQLLFRCLTCKRLAHYAHLPVPPKFAAEESDVVALAEWYQNDTDWQCSDCASYIFDLDKILAWRPYPPNAVEPSRPATQPPDHKAQLPREYLVKWESRSYRRIQWVPHMWLLARNPAKLKNFLVSGPKVELLQAPIVDEKGAMDVDASAPPPDGALPFEIGADEPRETSAKPAQSTLPLPAGATPDAERKIPPAWKTVDRVLDVMFWYSGKKQQAALDKRRKQNGKKVKKSGKGRGKVKRRVESDDEDSDEIATDPEDEQQRVAAFKYGEEPDLDLMETIDEWEERTGEELNESHIGRVVWAFLKWDDLAYDEATWDSPPTAQEPGYDAFVTAFKRFVDSRTVYVPKVSTKNIKITDRSKDGYKKRHALVHGAQPKLGQNPQLKLMPFQIDGVNWLCNNWWNLQHCILADDMGLGKTVQIVTFIGRVVQEWKGLPSLVVVPNSTITNWVREFERWAPALRVVPFYGEAKSRSVIKKYELYHENVPAGMTRAKYHVLITTYETLTNPADFGTVFKGGGTAQRWEILVVDEGQRLKSDSSLLFRKLNELSTVHRIIMTGTPLNNNIRELFNLMNFLDPDEWNDLESLEKEHEELTEELIKQLHNRLRPYFLRRIKSEVLQLPPKNEVIVPVTMSSLQKEVYRSILSQNLDLLKSLTQPSATRGSTISKSNMKNMLMQLRKCLQHPYLNSEEIEPQGLSKEETQEKLVAGSAKLRLLKILLPKLKARGHRVLLFSQFVIGLNVIEDFLIGEGLSYLRLDGNTKQAERQKGMDEFNKPNSEVFIYLLTTRAGGVGINLFSADTVIIYDPDFNPHQDLQAIARSYRYGQTKTCLVFKLMVKDSAEERIFQTGKKKLVLDHLIVQKMDDDEEAGEDVQSILTYGAKALFEEQAATKDIIYTEHDIEKLIEKTEKEGDQVEPENKDGGFSFAFAKVWSADKDSMEEVTDDAEPVEQADSWAQTLSRIELEAQQAKLKAQELTGRGVRRKAAAAVARAPADMDVDLDDTPQKDKKKGRKSKSKSNVSDESDAWGGSVAAASGGEDSDDSDDASAEDLKDILNDPKGKKKARSQYVPSMDPTSPHYGQHAEAGPSRKRLPSHATPLSPLRNHSNHDDKDLRACGLCGTKHGLGQCYMTESSEHLAEYRQILLVHGDDEPLEDRRVAIRAIDETLNQRGKIHLIHGQPLYLVEPTVGSPAHQKQKTTHKSAVPAPPRKPSASKPHDGTKTVSSNGTSSSLPRPVPRRPSSPIAGSSKRPSSPLASVQPVPKKPKHVPATCAICGASQYHPVKDCPVVGQGPKSVSREIKRLDEIPGMADTVKSLRKVLKQQKRQEEQLAASSDAIMISD